MTTEGKVPVGQAPIPIVPRAPKWYNDCVFREEEALEICQELIDRHQLKLRLLGAKPDGERVVFYFSSPERVNFKPILTELHQIFSAEIRFEQVGDREKAKMIGGLGRCGRPLCCQRWAPATPNGALSAQEGAALPKLPKKYTGACGKSLCCLLYEQQPQTSPAPPQCPDPAGSPAPVPQRKEKKARKKRFRRLKI